MKTTKYIETVTSERIKWLEEIRNDISDIFTSIDYICTSTTIFLSILAERETLVGINISNSNDRDFITSRVEKLKVQAEKLQAEIYNQDNKTALTRKLYLISLRLNYKEDQDIIKELDKAREILNHNRYDMIMIDELRQISQKVIIDIRTVLKNEWEKVKRESQKGRNTDNIIIKIRKLIKPKKYGE
jgi:hypothetical protein